MILAACLSNSGDGTVDSETHFLVACDSDEACSADRQCVCGVCSTPCGTTDVCTATSAPSACVDAPSIGCAAGPDVTLCLAICTSNSDCGGLGLTCVGGLCVEPDATVLPDVIGDVSDTDANTGTDATGDDVAVDSTTPPPDTSGPSLTCERCGESSNCPVGLVCGPWAGSGEPGAIPGLSCGAPTAGLQAECENYCQGSCGGLACGSSTGGCVCGSCPAGSACAEGACVDEAPCTDTGCNDVLGVFHCLGGQFERPCPAGASTCTCSAAGPVCDEICGPSTLATQAGNGESCATDEHCASGSCTAGVCAASTGGFGEPCSAEGMCAGNGVCIEDVCYEECNAADTACSGDTICYVAGDFAGFCVATCDRCNTPCDNGVCGYIWDTNGVLACVPPTFGPAASCSLRCTQLCFDAGATCGAIGNDCYCGDCESGQACNGGTCSDTSICGGEPCTDGFNSTFCEGTTAPSLCELESGFQSCLCTGAGVECDSDCGTLAVAGGSSYGTACTTGADCATGECSLGICGPSCIITTDNAPLYGCPEGFQCNVPGASSGYCLKECVGNYECHEGTQCLPSQNGEPEQDVCRLP